MKTQRKLPAPVLENKFTVTCRGFNLIELLVVVATLAILFSLVLPGLAKARIKSTGAGCLNNYRQMMIGWAMYKDNNNDVMVPNAPLGANPSWCGSSGENWTAASANTNRSLYLAALLAPYIANRIELYRCPADVIPSDNGPRIRSCSMNPFMGIDTANTSQAQNLLYGNSGWRQFKKNSDLICLTPAMAWIFCDETMASLNDGFLQMNLNSPSFPDCPAYYHEGAGCFSFADGHAELRRWSVSQPTGQGVLSVLYQHGFTANNISTSASDPDWIWLKGHSSCQ